MCRYCGPDAGTPWKILRCVVPRVRSGRVVSVDVGREGSGRFGQLAARLPCMALVALSEQLRIRVATGGRQAAPVMSEDERLHVFNGAGCLPLLSFHCGHRNVLPSSLQLVPSRRSCGADCGLITRGWKSGCIRRWHGSRAGQPVCRGR